MELFLNEVVPIRKELVSEQYDVPITTKSKCHLIILYHLPVMTRHQQGTD